MEKLWRLYSKCPKFRTSYWPIYCGSCPILKHTKWLFFESGQYLNTRYSWSLRCVKLLSGARMYAYDCDSLLRNTCPKFNLVFILKIIHVWRWVHLFCFLLRLWTPFYSVFEITYSDDKCRSYLFKILRTLFKSCRFILPPHRNMKIWPSWHVLCVCCLFVTKHFNRKGYILRLTLSDS